MTRNLERSYDGIIIGAGHHGPEEWVSVRSLGDYRRALVEFVNLLPARLGQDERPLRIA